MATQNTQVCCWGASTWTYVFAYFQIMVANVGGIFGLWASKSHWVDNVEDYKKRAQAMMNLVIVIVIVNWILGMLLRIGNKREIVGLIWTWLIVTGICAVLGVIAGNLSATAWDVSSLVCLVSTIISAAICTFMICVVHRRIRDIKNVPPKQWWQSWGRYKNESKAGNRKDMNSNTNSNSSSFPL